MPAYKDEERKTWYVRFYYTDWTGQRKQKKKRGFKTLREAKEFERNFLKEPPKNNDYTLQQLYDLYFADVSEKLRQSTIDMKDNIFKNHILPYFGKTKIKDISPASIRMWQNEILKQDLSDTYKRSINTQISAIMNYAVKYYGLTSNPCHIAGTIGKKHASEMNFWTLDEYSKFRATLFNEREICLFDILYWGGLRKGELLALTPADVIDGGLSITKTASFKKSQITISEPKTPKSRRKVTLPDFCMNELNDYILSTGMDVESACIELGMDEEKIQIIKLIYAREYYKLGNIKNGDIFIDSVESADENSERVLKILDYIKRNKNLLKAKIGNQDRQIQLSLTLYPKAKE